MESDNQLWGRQVVVWQAGQALGDPSTHAYKIATEYESEEPWVDTFAKFLASPGVEGVQAFVVGPWGEVATGDPPDPAIEALVGARNKLKSLELLYVGDILAEESEISWIHQGDLAPLLSAYPRLRELRVRGGMGLSLGRLDHANLERLVVETGGLDRSVVQQVMAANLPSLTHLELWLGDDGYGANTSPADFAAVLEGPQLPKLQTLALRNSQYTDELAKAIVSGKVLERISALDLSLGTLRDAGAEALLASPLIRRLKRLDVHHHYMSEAMTARLAALPLEVDVDDRMEPDEYQGESHYYVAVAE